MFQASDLGNIVYSLPWFEFEKNSVKKLLILMLIKFQKPVKITIFHIMGLDLELFVFVSLENFLRVF